MSPQVLQDYIDGHLATEAEKGGFASPEETEAFLNSCAMPNYRLTHEALAFLRKIPAKHARQIMGKIERLAEDPKRIPS